MPCPLSVSSSFDWISGTRCCCLAFLFYWYAYVVVLICWYLVLLPCLCCFTGMYVWWCWFAGTWCCYLAFSVLLVYVCGGADLLVPCVVALPFLFYWYVCVVVLNCWFWFAWDPPVLLCVNLSLCCDTSTSWYWPSETTGTVLVLIFWFRICSLFCCAVYPALIVHCSVVLYDLPWSMPCSVVLAVSSASELLTCCVVVMKCWYQWYQPSILLVWYWNFYVDTSPMNWQGPIFK